MAVDFVDKSGFLFNWPLSSAAVFVIAAVLLSLFLICDHLSVYNQPEEQKFLIGIVLMVPVYAIESFLSLSDSKIAFVCEIMRDCYEALALYCFERYLIACLGGEENTIMIMESKTQVTSTTPLLELEVAYNDGAVKHPFPLNCFLRKWYLGTDFYHLVKIGIVQYMLVKTICAFLAIILQLFGVYGEGKFELKYGYPYLAVVLNFSQSWALYCLVQFYSVTKEKLEPIKPLPKFLAFKSIIFLTWWQGVAVALLFSMGILKGSLAEELKTRIQDYIICIEMGIAAIFHLYIFPAKPYHIGERCIQNVTVMSDYASLGIPPDPEEVMESERLPSMNQSNPVAQERHLNFHQSVRDVFIGSGEIMVNDVKFTVSHVVEPVEKGMSKINKTFHRLSENVKRFEQCRRKSKDDQRRRRSKDDSYLVPMESWEQDLLEADPVPEGSMSDSGVSWRRPPRRSTPASRFSSTSSSNRSSFEFGGSRWS